MRKSILSSHAHWDIQKKSLIIQAIEDTLLSYDKAKDIKIEREISTINQNIVLKLNKNWFKQI